jgi:hypothetical protein
VRARHRERVIRRGIVGDQDGDCELASIGPKTVEEVADMLCTVVGDDDHREVVCRVGGRERQDFLH